MRIYPKDSLACPLKTDIWLWHDGDNLYVLWEAKIDEQFARGKFVGKDEWSNNDFLRIQIITDVKNYYAYMFCSFPFGNKYDGIRNPDLKMDLGWNSNYTYKNEISEDIWQSLMIIPFKDLRFFGNPPYKWNIIFTRYFYKDDEFYSIPYMPTNMGKDYFRKAYDITINEKINKAKNYRLSPYLIKKYDMIEKTVSFDPYNVGLDFSFNPSFSTKLKLSINPDFSDVPIDSEADIYNLIYAPTYHENRFFFIEDLDVFGVDSELFYSRHIMQPRCGIKLTGNSERFSYGFLSALDKKIIEDGIITNYDDIYNMLAFKPKWNNFSVQMTLLNRMNKNYHNEVFHLEPVWEFTNNQLIKFEIDTSIKDETEIKKGYSVYGYYDGKKGDFSWSVGGGKISKNYFVDMGQIYEKNYHNMFLDIDQYTEPNSKVIKYFGGSIWGQKAMFNGSGELFDQNIGINVWCYTQHKINLWTKYCMGQINYLNKIFDWHKVYSGVSWNKLNWFGFSITISKGKELNYNLFNTYDKFYSKFSVWGNLTKYFSYSVYAANYKWYDIPEDSGIDDEYWIANGDIGLDIYNNISFNNGLRFNNYKSDDLTMYLGFFSNFRWEFKPDCNLYLGYKTAVDEINQKFETKYKQTYMKISYTF
ncbi:MAG: hypothetical protein U9R23_07430 [Candidatus Cloacimonadota bacterium]|nr:hypothetical protein [Candidatus Cloacimonadota bacterium]